MVKPVLVPLLIYSLSHSFISASAHLPLELAVGPVPVCADGGGHVAAHAALGEQLEGGQLLLVQQRVAVVLIAHRHGGEELLAAVRAGHAGATRGQVPPVNTTRIRSSSQTQTHRSLSSSTAHTDHRHRHTDHCPAAQHTQITDTQITVQQHSTHRSQTHRSLSSSTAHTDHRHRHTDHCPAAQHTQITAHRHTDQIQLTDTDTQITVQQHSTRVQLTDTEITACMLYM